jgi:hypothetical protein
MLGAQKNRPGGRSRRDGGDSRMRKCCKTVTADRDAVTPGRPRHVNQME